MTYDGFGYRRFDTRAEEVGFATWNRELNQWCAELSGRPEWVHGPVNQSMAKTALLALIHIRAGTMDPRHVIATAVQLYGHRRLYTFIDIWCDCIYGPPGRGLTPSPRGNIQSQAIAAHVEINPGCRWACENINAWVLAQLEDHQTLRADPFISPQTIEERVGWTSTMILADQQTGIDFTQLPNADLAKWMGGQDT